jgi:hypothetical protein
MHVCLYPNAFASDKELWNTILRFFKVHFLSILILIFTWQKYFSNIYCLSAKTGWNIIRISLSLSINILCVDIYLYIYVSIWQHNIFSFHWTKRWNVSLTPPLSKHRFISWQSSLPWYPDGAVDTKKVSGLHIAQWKNMLNTHKDRLKLVMNSSLYR